MLYPLRHLGEGDLQVMPVAEFNKLAVRVLEYVGNSSVAGSLFLTNPGNATSIGTFPDTYVAGNVGEALVSVSTNTVTLYQDLNTPANTWPSPMLVYDAGAATLRRAANVEINVIADAIIEYGVLNDGPATYRLGTTAPSDGGVWVSAGTVTQKETLYDATPTTYTLYRKINQGSGTTFTSSVRPIKQLTPGNFQRYTDGDIQTLARRVQERIISTGIGKYALQSTAPTPGTWVIKGTLVDYRQNVTAQSYINETVGSYVGKNTFIQNQEYLGTLVFDAPNTAYEGGPAGATYHLDPITSYTLSYTSGPTGFTGPATFTSTYTGYVTFDIAAPGISYEGAAYILGPTAFSGDVNYDTTYTLDTYASVNTYTGFATYATEYATTYTSISYAGTEFISPGAINYFGAGGEPFLRVYTINYETFTGLYGADYNLTTNYDATFADLGQYVGPLTTDFTSTYAGPVQYVGYSPGTAYQALEYLAGPTQYSTQTSFISNFTGTSSYDSVIPAVPYTLAGYTAQFTSETIYDIQLLYTSYVNFAGSYDGGIINTPVDTISTIYLWRRIA